MNSSKAHKIWIEQCEAAHTIRARFGLKAAFDYLVGEKLINFADAASRHCDFAQELPRFISEVRRIFVRNDRGIIDRNYAWDFVTNSSLRNALG
jgi:hypothetical protein